MLSVLHSICPTAICIPILFSIMQFCIVRNFVFCAEGIKLIITQFAVCFFVWIVNGTSTDLCIFFFIQMCDNVLYVFDILQVCMVPIVESSYVYCLIFIFRDKLLKFWHINIFMFTYFQVSILLRILIVRILSRDLFNCLKLETQIYHQPILVHWSSRSIQTAKSSY